MSREARKTAQIWASIEKMQKKEDELSLSDNSSDKTLKQQRKKKKHKQSPSDDDTPSTGPGKVAATNEPTSLGNNESTYHTSMLTLHKSSEFMRSSPFVPPRKKWVSRWETHHHQGPQGSHSEAEVARLGHDEEPLTIAPDNSSSVPTSTTSSATLVVGTDDAMGEVLTSTSPPASSTQHLVSPHHAPSSQLTHPPHLDHHATSAATTVPTIELPAPPLPQESQGILHPPSAVKGTIPNSRPTFQGILPHETEAEEGEYTANSPTNAAVAPQVVVDLGSTDLSPRGPIDSIVAAPSVASSRVQQEEHVPIEGSDGIVPKEISPSAPVVASPVMNALGSRRKRKSLWDVGDPRVEESGEFPRKLPSNPHRRGSEGGGSGGSRSASADGRRRSWSRSYPSTTSSNTSGTTFTNASSNHHNYPPPSARRHTPPPQQPPSFLKPRDPPARSMSSSWLPSR
ncbi:hypothetical protein H257_17883 [Aphanomyces astaci]|uniref:Uncharacterized protein n=1 Tax=Aphanomyces astaci TaxID=112090 RepID=W4FCY6_APHAT|nr:hypothetical protein H257_17883 [Aphanomyces astaci]ETV65345.1 hypothetical protein H257_17883 [Aphanomyces astaci]|eukprot:XP_009845140.1 hypothetical protein H257_17883 [Aphanomyces astaci]